MNIQTKPLNEFYIHSVLSFQVVESFFQNQSNTRNWFSVLILISKQENSDANNFGTINNGYFIWCTFESFCNKKESNSVIFKEESQSGKNLLVHSLLPTKYYEISQTKYHYSILLLTNIHVFAEKGRKCGKIGRRLSVKLTAQQTFLKN